ncbi:cornifelin homolog [Ornithorhynchus anatinus]|uniref:cornifelin homolog n=1 Tax=Ornithorhynchus anatinus TaxID=9258 RepID=UPI0010A7BD97|nr:cornifelin homolog [Ornithorhynchus anatinus]
MEYQVEVVGTQPGPIGGMTVMENPGSWSSELCDCCGDCSVCEDGEEDLGSGPWGTLLPCASACRVAERADECCRLPFLPGTPVALRTGVRAAYGIQGSISDDWLVMVCCPHCGLCQLARQQKTG